MKLSEYLDLIKIALSFIPGLMWKFFKPDIWVFSERPNEARDNGFWMFNYIMKNNLHTRSYYTIKNNSPDYKKIVTYKKNIIKYGSFKHFALIWACSKYISAHIDDGYPSQRVCYKLKMLGIYRFKFVFLQHGVIHNYHDFYNHKNTHADKIICSSLKELNFLINTCNYNENSAKCVGLARFDGLIDNSKNKKQILIMPTWRRNLVNNSQKIFENAIFFRNFIELLTNPNLQKFIHNKKLTINFFLHKELQKFCHSFKSAENERTKIIDYRQSDIQDVLKNSSFLVTDYSSIAFDFGYMQKPLVYFQFDYDDFRNKHTKCGYFDYENDGFGKVCKTNEEVTKAIIASCEKNFRVNETYLKRANEFFAYHDTKNSLRNFEIIKSC